MKWNNYILVKGTFDLLIYNIDTFSDHHLPLFKSYECLIILPTSQNPGDQNQMCYFSG